MGFPIINDGDTVVFDTETNGLDWKTCHTVGFVITLDRDGQPITQYFPIRHETGPNMDPSRVIAWVKSWAKKKIHLVGHHLKFDLHFAANDGIFFDNATFEDTEINAGLINEHEFSFALGNIAGTYSAPAKKGKLLYEHMASLFGGPPDRKQMANFWRLPANDALAVEYAEGDGDTTYYVHKNQQPHLDLQDLRDVWALECKVIPCLFRMERRGVLVDEDQFQRLKNYISREIERAEKNLPWEGFNVRGRKDLPKAFTDAGHTDWPTTPKGNPSFTEDWLSGNGLGRDIIKVRKLTNLMNTFIVGAVETNLYNGRIHTNFNQLRGDDFGTQTGRLSSNGPNMQQVPKRDKLLAPIFRSIFRADNGCAWQQNDYSQQEYRIFACYAQSANLIKGYNEGLDMHGSVAEMLSVERDPTAKRMNLGMLYWMGAPKLALALGITLEEAMEFRRMYDEKLPEVKEFLYRCQRRGRNIGYVRTIKRRRQRFPDRNFAYRGASRVIQGTCADLTKEKMVQVDDFLRSESRGELGVALQVHDELDWCIPHDALHLGERAREMMSDFSGYDFIKVPMIVDCGQGDNWGQASFPNVDWGQYE